MCIQDLQTLIAGSSFPPLDLTQKCSKCTDSKKCAACKSRLNCIKKWKSETVTASDALVNLSTSPGPPPPPQPHSNPTTPQMESLYKLIDESGYVTTVVKNKLQPLHVTDMINVQVGETLRLVSLDKCEKCGGNLELGAINGSAAITIDRKCDQCEEKSNWSSSQKLVGKGTKNAFTAPVSEVVGALLAGQTYRSFSEAHDLSNVRHLTEDAWKRWEEKTCKVVMELVEESEHRFRKELVSNKKFNVAVDCRWSSRGYNAEEGTVTCCSLPYGKVIYHSHLLRIRSRPSEVHNYTGTSKGMEGEGVSRICTQMKSDGYEMGTVSHDNDASSIAQIVEVFPSAIEQLDIGHAAKNICVKVKEAAKYRGDEARELKGFSERVKCRFQTVAYEAKGDVEKFKKKLRNSILHWSEDHSKCAHGLQTHHYTALSKDGPGAAALLKILEFYIQDAEKYVTGACSNVLEAINNKYTVYVPKRLDFPKNYGYRANLAILEHNEGEVIKVEIIRRLGLLISPTMLSLQHHRQLRKERDQERKRKQQTKNIRAQNKEKKKKRGKKILNEAHTYKGGCLPDDEKREQNKDTAAPSPKKQRVDPGKCGCASASACSNRQCSCVAFGRGCSLKCKCKDTCKNKVVYIA